MQPGALRVKLKFAVVRFDGFIVGPTLEEWNSERLTWPHGACAYGDTCAKGAQSHPEYARSRYALLEVANSVPVPPHTPHASKV